jgi:4-hydroxybenzoate polyprenyltransferase
VPAAEEADVAPEAQPDIAQAPVPAEDRRAAPRRGPLGAVVAAMRPQQWIKNLFVAAPLVFAKSLLDGPQALRAAAAVALFCLVSSAIYLWNDIVDVEKDRAHPRKRRRPIASGELSIGAARALSIAFASVGVGLGFALAPRYGAAVTGYIALNLSYSLLLKRLPYLDVLTIAGGFLLRVLAGALAIDVYASPWLFLCTGLLASFVGFGKRAHELATSGTRTRSVLAAYRSTHLKLALYATGIATIAAYICYTLAAHTRAFFHTSSMVWTVPLIALGLGRYMTLVSGRPRAESPTEEMLRDPLFMTNLALYAAAVVTIIYVAR